MNQSQYRTLVASSLAIGILAAALDVAVPSLLPEPFHAAQAEYDETVATASLGVGLLIGIPGVCLALAGTYGLFRFRQWAPRIALIGTGLGLLAISLFGPTAQSGPATALELVSSYLWGAAILIPYVPHYRVWFTGTVAANPGEA